MLSQAQSPGSVRLDGKITKEANFAARGIPCTGLQMLVFHSCQRQGIWECSGKTSMAARVDFCCRLQRERASPGTQNPLRTESGK